MFKKQIQNDHQQKFGVTIMWCCGSNGCF